MSPRVASTALSVVLLACIGDSGTPSGDGGKNDVEAGPSTFCATHTTSKTLVCADFDTTLDAGFTGAVVDDDAGASLSLDTTNAFSPPNALVASLSSSPNPVSAMLELDPVGAPGNFAGSLRMKVNVPACFIAPDEVAIAALQFYASNVLVYDIEIRVGLNGSAFVYAANFAESGVNTQHFGANQLLPLGVWADVELDLTTAGTPHVNLVQQGQVVLSTDLLPGSAAGLPRFMVGARASTLKGTCAIELDNVTLDSQ
jgi:hypothetical protein